MTKRRLTELYIHLATEAVDTMIQLHNISQCEAGGYGVMMSHMLRLSTKLELALAGPLKKQEETNAAGR